jgi:prepilin-type N-terminal cleavage/methylation domain-containing protein
MLTTPSLRARRGFTLAEVLIAMVILAVVGVAFTRTVVSNSRFFDRQTNLRGTRSVARNSMQVLMSELRMVQDSGGIDSASTDGKTIRVKVPYRFGLYCADQGGSHSVVSMLPVDSAMIQQTKYAGYAWRNRITGRWTIVEPTDPLGADIFTDAPQPALCTGSGAGEAQVGTVTVAGRAGNILRVRPPINNAAASPGGTAIFFFQKITYRFAASTKYSGKIGLYRDVQGGTSEELMAPFDTSARFRFYTSAADVSLTTPPSLALIRGIDLVLNSVGSRAVAGSTDTVRTYMTTAVFFKNTRRM